MLKQEPNAEIRQQKNQRLTKRLVFITLGMFFFGFALVPLYNVMCKVGGINGKTDPSQFSSETQFETDKSRTVTVEFTTTMNESLPWEFRPMHKKVELHPGEVFETAYFAKNLTDKTMIIQAIPSITPGMSAQYFKKIECFCFEKQVLDGGESAEMPLRFVLDPNLPKEFHTITLSYTLFDITNPESSVKGEHHHD